MKIPQKYLLEVCKLGKGEVCCRYLSNNGGVWMCAKFTPLRAFLDKRSASGAMRAKGDNCEGLSPTDEKISLSAG